jgi:hypothetical protein
MGFHIYAERSRYMNQESEVTKFMNSKISARDFLEGKTVEEDAMISSNFNIPPQVHAGWKKEPRDYDPDPEDTDSKTYDDSDIDELFGKRTQMPIIKHEIANRFDEPSQDDFDRIMQEMVRDAGTKAEDDSSLPSSLRGLF